MWMVGLSRGYVVEPFSFVSCVRVIVVAVTVVAVKVNTDQSMPK